MAKGFEIKGINEIKDVLAGLPDKFGNKVVEDVLNKAAKPLIREAKQNASHSDVTGNLSKSIGAIKNKQEGQTVGITVGPRRSKGYKGHHAHLVEYGTAPRQVKKKQVLAGNGKFWGKSVASSPAQPFLRPAYDSKIDTVQNEIKKEFQSILQSGFKNVFK